MSEPKKNPFANCKPRDQWKPRKRKLRRLEDVCVGNENGVDQFKLCWFELTKDGLKVRFKHGRTFKVLPYQKLANGVNPTGQMSLV